ncbi:ABSCISIC ACID-INSENSITIVE 5-like protein 2 [Hevea brasiliensis]|uniref:ABSCISIC ACID-INSENSITIVE 5-like protein 2 n=1 Tax=Hevea brasiliensis TaxID=3981 RepID=UPI0025FEF281|nr:ABSCISIC ACID-INSENSITIVE 5-like protein 2 [Hevea brasiliensis]
MPVPGSVVQGFPQTSMLFGHGGRKRIIEGSEEDLRRKERKKIRNRASAARSREKKMERTKFLEEKVEELREENAQMERLVKLIITGSSSLKFIFRENERSKCIKK